MLTFFMFWIKGKKNYLQDNFTKCRMKYLVTGGCGFIGSNFIHRCFEQRRNVEIINLDAMLTGSNPMNLHNLNNTHYRFVKGNICDRKLVEKLVSQVDCVINFAAESHVDRSISDPNPFIQSNILGVYSILESIRRHKVKFLQISTDEVYGEILKGSYFEHDTLHPSNPYSATKASAEMLVQSYAKTYDLDVKITRCCNNFGPRQFPEKLIPKAIICALKKEPIPIHGNGSAKRQWIHVFDHCDAILQILSHWGKSLIYNIPGNYETTNMKLVKNILGFFDKYPNSIVYVKDRPGQDRRYNIKSKILSSEIGFKPKIKFENALETTICWYLENKKLWEHLSFKTIKNPTPWL